MAQLHDELAIWALPKTGSSWVATVCSVSIGPGRRAKSIHTDDGLDGFLGDVLTIVRHPYTWIPSCWGWMTRNPSSRFPGPAGVLRNYMTTNVDEFAVNSPVGLISAVFAPSIERATEIVRTESLKNDVGRVLQKHGQQPKVTVWDVVKGQARNIRVVRGYPVNENVTAAEWRRSLSPDTCRIVGETQRDFIEKWYS